MAVQADRHALETIEGLSPGADELLPLAAAFARHHGLQCGYCTPGILMSALAYLREVPQPTETQVREMLSGHLCRCTGYQFIVDSIQAAARELQ
jgi:carbon-monoxide dehydrogenase small subunit